MENNNLKIIVFILLILVLYLLYRDICHNNNLKKVQEKFSTETETETENLSIKESIKVLGLIAKKIQDQNTLTVDDLTITGSLTVEDELNILKGLTVVGNTSLNGQFDVQGSKGSRTCFSVRYNKNNGRMETRVDNWLHIGGINRNNKGTLFIEDVLIAAKDKHNRAIIDFSTKDTKGNDRVDNLEKSITGNDSYVSTSYLIADVVEAIGTLQAGVPKKGDVNFLNSNLNNVKQINVDFIHPNNLRYNKWKEKYGIENYNGLKQFVKTHHKGKIAVLHKNYEDIDLLFIQSDGDLFFNKRA